MQYMKNKHTPPPPPNTISPQQNLTKQQKNLNQNPLVMV